MNMPGEAPQRTYGTLDFTQASRPDRYSALFPGMLLVNMVCSQGKRATGSPEAGQWLGEQHKVNLLCLKTAQFAHH